MTLCATDRAGAVADYIPELTRVDPDGYGLSLCMHDGHLYSHGDSAEQFTIQSISKALTYALVLTRLGPREVDAKIGVEPSGEAFNEISVDGARRPKNPMINAGAIMSASLLLPQVRDADSATMDSESPEVRTVDAVFDDLVSFYSACAGRRLHIDDAVYRSERRTGARNRAIAYMLDSFGVLDADPEAALDLYLRQCSLRVTTDDLAVIGCTLATGGVNPRTGRQIVSPEVAQRVLSVMTTCGMYDGAGDWVSSVGLPAKSGVGGGILAILPGQLGIGVYSPRLDAHGNSVRGIDTCRHLSTDLGLHMFNVTRESRVTMRATYDIGEFEVGADWTERERGYLRTCRDRVRPASHPAFTTPLHHHPADKMAKFFNAKAEAGRARKAAHKDSISAKEAAAANDGGEVPAPFRFCGGIRGKGGKLVKCCRRAGTHDRNRGVCNCEDCWYL